MSQFNLVNSLLLEVTTNNETIFSKKSSMVAVQGDIHYSRSFLTGGGIQQLAMREATGEGMIMMAGNGTGKAYYAFQKQYITNIPLAGDILYVESDQILAFDSTLRPDTFFIGNQGLIQGLIKGATTDQGLFTTTLEGKGNVAILSEGNAIALDVSHDRPIHVDPDAYIGHRGELMTKFVTDINWKTLVGQASGESYQLKFIGQGTVYIQASERQ